MGTRSVIFQAKMYGYILEQEVHHLSAKIKPSSQDFEGRAPSDEIKRRIKHNQKAHWDDQVGKRDRNAQDSFKTL